MNSKKLQESGFTELYSLKELSLTVLPSNDGHVFVLVDKTLSEQPTSDILYIGRAKKPVKKILGGYVGGLGGKTVKKIHNALFNEGYIERVSISWMPNADPKATQKELLETFKKEHGGYPPWNSPAKAAEAPKPRQKTVKRSRTPKSTVQKKQAA